MTDAAFKASLKSIDTAVSKLTTESEDTAANVKMMKQLITVMHQRIEDISKKFDEILNGSKRANVAVKAKAPAKAKAKPKKPAKKAASTDAVESKDEDEDDDDDAAEEKVPAKAESDVAETTQAPVKNVMTYFKFKFANDITCFDTVLEEKQRVSLFKEHADDLKTKKGALLIKAQSALLYKNITAAQKKKIREQMLAEAEAVSADNDVDIEAETSGAE